MRNGMWILGLAVAVGAGLFVAEARAQDVSNDFNNPTRITLTEGSNFLTETIVDSEAEALNPGAGDLDFFTLVVPLSLQLDEIVVTDADALGFAFFGFAAGESLDGSPALPGAGRDAFVAQAWGYTLLNLGSVGNNLLPELSTGAVTGQRIDPVRFDGDAALPSGLYAFVLQNRQNDLQTYTFDFRTSAVPEPASAALLGGALIGLAAVRRRARA